MNRIVAFVFILFPMLLCCSCTKLDETYEGNLTGAQVGNSTSTNTEALLTGVYNSIRKPFQDIFSPSVLTLSELTTDALIAPTRGPDWDDNGDWRKLHQHRWDANHVRLRNNFNSLSSVVFAATDLLRFHPTSQQAAEARLLRAWAMYWLLDFYDQVPYRDPGESVVRPARVRKGTEALNYIISEIYAVSPDLPINAVGLANKDAAKVFLMKCYLNKGVYKNRASPTFDATDLNKVISLADEIINSNKYTFSASYFDNFSPENTTIGRENIWTQENVGGVSPGAGLNHIWNVFLHYFSTPGGFNGWATLPDFYNKFEEADKRRGQIYPTIGLPNPGNRINVGFLAGQQYNLITDAPLNDRLGNPLVFTQEVKIIETGNTLERAGIRIIKYPVDGTNIGTGSINNDYVYFRLPDVLLMKAEAILRGGTPTDAGSYGNTALSLVNAIRTHPSREASALSSISLDELLDERGRELYLEGWRRQDLIRFGKFLQPFYEKNYTSEDKYLLFPIPNQQLGVNENLTQNHGY